MKCEHCGKNEVSFIYRSNMNGKVDEKHLCADCAEKLGYTQPLHDAQFLLGRLFRRQLLWKRAV